MELVLLRVIQASVLAVMPLEGLCVAGGLAKRTALPSRSPSTQSLEMVHVGHNTAGGIWLVMAWLTLVLQYDPVVALAHQVVRMHSVQRAVIHVFIRSRAALHYYFICYLSTSTNNPQSEQVTYAHPQLLHIRPARAPIQKTKLGREATRLPSSPHPTRRHPPLQQNRPFDNTPHLEALATKSDTYSCDSVVKQEKVMHVHSTCCNALPTVMHPSVWHAAEVLLPQSCNYPHQAGSQARASSHMAHGIG